MALHGGVSFLNLVIPRLILGRSFVHCHWKKVSLPSTLIHWFGPENRRNVLCFEWYRERECRRDGGIPEVWRGHFRRTFRIGLPHGFPLKTICSLRGSGQASSRWKMDAQFLSVLLSRLPSFTCDVYTSCLQCETRNVKVSFAETFFYDEDVALLDR